MLFTSGRTALTDDIRVCTHVLLLCVASLVGIGLVTIFSIVAAQGAADGVFVTNVLVRRVAWTLLGVVGLLIASRLNLTWLEEQAPFLLLMAGVLLIVVLVPGIGTRRFGARRWIRAGSFGVQPSEFVKWCLVIFIASYAKAQRLRMHTWRDGLIMPGIGLGLICMLVLLEPDFGTVALMGTVCLALLVVGGARLWKVGVIGTSGVALLLFLVRQSPSRWRRITAFLDPESHASGAAYQMIQALVGVGSGGWLGAGAGAGGQKYFYLPQAGTDFIYAVIGEEFGFLGAAIVLGLFGGIIVCGFHIARATHDDFASLLATGVTLFLGIQALIHMAVVTGSAPTKGITLPFVSMGGSSLVASMVGVGLLVGVARRASEEAAVSARGNAETPMTRLAEGTQRVAG